MFLVASSFRKGTQGYSPVSDNNNFVTHQSPWSDYGYRAYGELSHFVYCLLQKIKASGSLPVVERWESYMLPSHSSFEAIEEDRFLVGTCVHAALEKMTDRYLKEDFRSSPRRILEKFTSTVLSTVAARSRLGQGVSCFCPEIIIRGNDHSTFFLFGQILDGLNVFAREKGSNVEPSKTEIQSFVQDQRQLECPGSRKHYYINTFLSYLTHQSGFRSRRHLYRVSFVGLQVDFFAVIKNKHCSEFQIFQLTTLLQHGPAEEIPGFELSTDRVSISRGSIDFAICCVQSYLRNHLFTQRDFSTDDGISMLLSAVSFAGSVCEDSAYEPWNLILPEGYGVVVEDLKKAYDVVVVRRSMLGTPLKDGLVWLVSSLLLLESPQVSKVYGSSILSKSERWSICRSPFPPRKCQARVIVLKVPQRGNRRKVRRQLQLQLSVDLNLMMSRLCCPRDGVYFDDPNFAIALKDQDKTGPSHRNGRS